jgi:hypothetical protein
MNNDDIKVGSRVTIGARAFPRGEGTVSDTTPFTVTVRLDDGKPYVFARSDVYLATHS